MKTVFNNFFEKVYVINLAKNTERWHRVSTELVSKGLCSSDGITRVEAVHGDSLPHPQWWRCGNGAWGCYRSHLGILQDVIRDKISSFLVIEDDTVFDERTNELFPDLMKALPETWGQFYLGGQHHHCLTPVELPNTKSLIMTGKSINRTHAFAATNRCAVQMFEWLSDYHNHIDKTWEAHIDHMLEEAQQKGMWETYCPRWWIAGQGSNNSDINGNAHPEMWWDFDGSYLFKTQPIVLVRGSSIPYNMRNLLHAGYNKRDNYGQDIGVSRSFETKNDKNIADSIEHIAWEAWFLRRLGTIHVRTEEEASFVYKNWGNVIDMREIMNNQDVFRQVYDSIDYRRHFDKISS